MKNYLWYETLNHKRSSPSAVLLLKTLCNAGYDVTVTNLITALDTVMCYFTMLPKNVMWLQ